MPPIEFWRQVIHRHTVPIYVHPCLQGAEVKVDNGSITDSDDHIWSGNKADLENGRWREFFSTEVSDLLGKRKCTSVRYPFIHC